MRPDNGILAGFQCSVEIGHDGDVVGNEPGRAKRSLQFRREVDEDNPCAGFARRLLDLREALRRRGINGDAATRLALKAKVAQPITTPIRTPAIKPQLMISTAIAISDKYSMRSNCRDDWIIH